MSDPTLTERLQQLQRKIDLLVRRREEIDREIQEKTEDFRAVKRVADRDLLVGKPINDGAESVPNSRHGQVRNDVLNAIREIPGPFRVVEVINRISLMSLGLVEPDKSSVSSCLKRLSDEKMLEIVEPGAGRRPTKYILKPKEGMW